MTEPAQRVADETATHRATTDSPLPGRLRLRGRVPALVFVKYYAASSNPDSKEIVGFGARSSGPFYRDGLAWNCDGIEYSKFVTFEFPAEVDELSCEGLYYSDHYSATPRQQALCILPSAAEMTYHFKVHFISGALHDPKIVVTPITAPGDGDADADECTD